MENVVILKLDIKTGSLSCFQSLCALWFLWGELERAGDVSELWEGSGDGGDILLRCAVLEGSAHRGGRLFPNSFLTSPVTGPEARDTHWNTIPYKQQETLFHWEGDQALAQVAQGGSGDSIPEDIQKSSGRGPEHPALSGPDWAGGWTYRGPFQPQSIYSFVILCLS